MVGRRRRGGAFVMVLLLAGGCGAAEKPPARASAAGSAGATTTAERQRPPTSTSTSTPSTRAPAPPGPTLPPGDDTTIVSITDGDTVRVAGGTRVRLIGIDTPETVAPASPVECFGPQASARLAALVAPGTPVRLAYDVERLDRYGRTLAYVYRLDDATFVNAAMVRDGYASAYTVPPDVAHADEFVALQRQARDAGRGLWSACPATPAPAAPPTTAAGPPPVAPLVGSTGAGSCDPSYPDVCIPPAPPDLDCPDVPYRRFRVVGSDPHRFDADHDGVGCES